MKFRAAIQILGTRGIPASHGGFETFAEKLALFLVSRGWDVTVYCQSEVPIVVDRIVSDRWRGIERRHVSVSSSGPRATLEFDWHCVKDAARRPGVCLVLGYNGAAFLPYLRLYGRKVMTNMDGIEWKRPKWGMAARSWFWVNEWIAAWTSHRLIADHPAIAKHVATRRGRDAIRMIPYGGHPVTQAGTGPVWDLGLEPGNYLLSIARIEPDNNIAAFVEAFSKEKRGCKLVVVGTLDMERAYHRQVMEAASDEVVFPGAIYDATAVSAIRFHARAYLHGHMVGGTNPSLVEALWAGNAVIAHDNPFNRWTAGDAGAYFDTAAQCEACMVRAIEDDAFIADAQSAARRRAREEFVWDDVLAAYETEAAELLGLSLIEGRTRASALVGQEVG